MGYISKYNTKLVLFMQRKYKEYKIEFKFIDDYLIFLFDIICNRDVELYYKTFEKDIMEYSDFQTGNERKMKPFNPNNLKDWYNE